MTKLRLFFKKFNFLGLHGAVFNVYKLKMLRYYKTKIKNNHSIYGSNNKGIRIWKIGTGAEQ